MVPKRKSPIVTLDDVRQRTYGRATAEDVPFASLSSLPRNLNRASIQRQRSSRNDPSTFGGKNKSGFCQPVTSSTSNITKKPSIPCHVIPNMPQGNVCEETLQRIHREFLPIIQRRGYNIKSISELCCCGDGLDFIKGSRRVQCQRMGNNVLGYNQTVLSSSSSTRSQRYHTIHLRLRHPGQHGSLFSWEDVAGTMAHELAHCVHGRHNEQFFKLMDEILEEHYQLQLHGTNGPSWLKPTNSHLVHRPGRVQDSAAVIASMPDSSGQRLGGNKSRGKSRLVDEFDNGRKLGDVGGSRGVTSLNMSPRELRELAAKAAEARQRQLQQVRRMIIRAKEPCIIEILDDDDDDDDDDYSEQAEGDESKPAKRFKQNADSDEVRPSAKRNRASSMVNSGDTTEEICGSKGDIRVSKNDGRSKDSKSEVEEERVQPNHGKKITVIDLTSSDSHHSDNGIHCKTCTFKNDSNCSNCAMCASAISESFSAGLDCRHCTFRNDVEATFCAMCGSDLT
ncbi:WLM domain containing protein [Nitzschia inconspicua]|uniref:WLM domain containing protein n=1 Tax=Nitzschia inconspicua TaxID=303405 RepID=A0A9K3LNQ5_9STRA|nr:WLM domain containing protein [Nitzschia inconspicua]